jgi:hypothetical protein
MGQASQLGQNGSDHGQYGQTNMSTPYGMNAMANTNMQQNENTQNVGDYNPVLPNDGLTSSPQKQWYPGMYPSTSSQFGTNPYSPQTANIQGHPGHNPSTIANVNPNTQNNAYSNQGQFVQRMATGGDSSFTGQAKQWAGPVSSNAVPEPDPMTAMFSSKGFGSPDKVTPSSGPMYGKGPDSVLGPLIKQDPNFAKQLGVNSDGTPISDTKNQQTNIAPVAPVTVSNPVYTPSYAQYAPVNPRIDSYGNPLFNSGGLASIQRK